MTLFKDFLKEKAKFYSPPTAGDHADVTDISLVEVQAIQKDWLPVAAWKDAEMIENLLKTVDDYLGDLILPEPHATWEARFEPVIDDEHTLLSWSVNKQKSHAMGMVKFGAIDALGKVMHHLDHPIQVMEQSVSSDEKKQRSLNPPSPFKSKVDYVLLGRQGKVLVEVVAPNIMDLISSVFESPSHRISITKNQPLSGKIISKMCLYMGSQRAQWLALTSHHKWIFFRLHNDREDPYLTYSSIIHQQDDTRPFRALLGMMFASEFETEVPCKVTRTLIGEKGQEDDDDNNKDLPVLRSEQQSGSSPGLLISWSRRVTDHDYWFVCDTVIDSDWCPRFTKSKGPVRFRLVGGIGEGVTGVVYEGKIDIDGKGEDPCSRTFALKILQKNESDAPLLIEGLHKELSIYRAIEQAKQEGKIRSDIVPRCYGLFEGKDFFVFAMEYAGKALKNSEWRSLALEDKLEVFKLILELHEIGIQHNDLDPRNTVRCDDGTFKIIDFTMSKFHKCKGSRDVSWYLKHGHNLGFDYGCVELNDFWLALMKPYVSSDRSTDGTV